MLDDFVWQTFSRDAKEHPEANVIVLETPKEVFLGIVSDRYIQNIDDLKFGHKYEDPWATEVANVLECGTYEATARRDSEGLDLRWEFVRQTAQSTVTDPWSAQVEHQEHATLFRICNVTAGRLVQELLKSPRYLHVLFHDLRDSDQTSKSIVDYPLWHRDYENLPADEKSRLRAYLMLRRGEEPQAFLTRVNTLYFLLAAQPKLIQKLAKDQAFTGALLGDWSVTWPELHFDFESKAFSLSVELRCLTPQSSDQIWELVTNTLKFAYEGVDSIVMSHDEDHAAFMEWAGYRDVNIWDYLFEHGYDTVFAEDEPGEHSDSNYWATPDLVTIEVVESVFDPSFGATRVGKTITYSETLANWQSTKLNKVSPQAHLNRLEAQARASKKIR